MARAVPSGRDLRKYARLFLRTDHDSDGFISADEAKAVFNKSYLPPDVLINIFNQANVSQSPYLTFPEFVAAMHLIREARQTQQPSQFPSISAELMNFLSNFYESPWDLAIQGSSKSAQALKQSAQSAQSAHGDPTHQSFSKGDPTYQTQAACLRDSTVLHIRPLLFRLVSVCQALILTVGTTHKRRCPDTYTHVYTVYHRTIVFIYIYTYTHTQPYTFTHAHTYTYVITYISNS